MNRYFAIALVVLASSFGGCRNKEPSVPEKHYQLAGEIKAMNVKDRTVTIKHGPIGDWMGAMTMEYPVKSKSELDSLHVGDQITATVDVRGDLEYDISNIHKQSPGK